MADVAGGGINRILVCASWLLLDATIHSWCPFVLLLLCIRSAVAIGLWTGPGVNRSANQTFLDKVPLHVAVANRRGWTLLRPGVCQLR